MKLSLHFPKIFKSSTPKPPQTQMANRITPLKTDFLSTKDLFEYAQKRCIDALNSEKPYEHTVVADTKKNKVIAEYIGDGSRCRLNGIDKLSMDKDNIVLLHGHPNGTPLSMGDIKTLIKGNFYQVIAFDRKGHFSIAARLSKLPEDISREFENLKKKYFELTSDIPFSKENELYNMASNYILKKHTSDIGLKYVTNYPDAK